MSDQNETAAIVRLGASVGLHSIAQTHRTLCEAFAKYDDIAVDATGIIETDLSLVQLIESARLTAVEQRKRFALTAPAAGPLHETLRRGGFLNPDTPSARFWLHLGD